MSRSDSAPILSRLAGCLGSLLVVSVVLGLLGVAAAGTLLRPFPSPTPLPRADGNTTDSFTLPAGSQVEVRRLMLDVQAEALPAELDEPMPVYFEADVEVPSEGSLQLAVVDGSGTEMIRQRRVAADIDVRWQISCQVGRPCHEEFDMVFSRSASPSDLDVSWRVKAQIRYPRGGLAPAEATLALAIQPAAAQELEPVLQASSDAEVLQLSAEQPLAIRHMILTLSDTASLSRAELAGMRAFVRTQLTVVPEPTTPPVGPSWAIPPRDRAPVEVLLWTDDGPDPEVARTLTAPGAEQIDQLELGSACAAARTPCNVDIVVLFRLLSDRTDATYELTWQLDAQLLARRGSIGPETGITVTPLPAPTLEALLQTEVQREITLTSDMRFSAMPAALVGLLDPATLTPELPILPLLSVADLTATASVSGSTRSPLLQLSLSGAEYGEPGSVRQFRPGDEAALRFIPFGACAADRPCGFNRSINVGVIDVAEEMTSDESVTVTLTIRLTVLGFASAEADGVVLTAEFR